MQRIGRFGAGLVLVLGLAVIVGWYADLPALTSVAPGYASMKPNSALSLATLGLCLLLPAWRWAPVAAAAAVVLGLDTLSKDVAGVGLPFDGPLPGIDLGSESPLMAVSTATAVVALGSAVVLHRPWAKRVLAMTAFAIGYLGLIGYLYGVSSLYSVGGYASMAVHTAACVCLLSLAMLLQDPDRGLVGLLRDRGSAGALARPMVPFLLIGPAGLGWATLWIQREGWIDTEFGVALLVTGMTVLGGAMTWRSALRLRAADGRESVAREALLASNRDLEGAVAARTLELDRAAQRLQSIVRLAPVGIVELDARGRLTTCNEQWTVLSGLDLEASRGEGWAQAVHFEDVETVRAGWASCVESGSVYDATLRFVTPRGRINRVHARTAPFVENGVVTGHLGTVSDVTVLHAAEERFRRLLEAAPDAMLGVDADGTIRMVNTQTERLFGYEARDLLGSPIEILIPDRFRARHPQYRRGYVEDPRVRPMGAGTELMARRRDGTEFAVDVSLSSLDTDDGLLVLAGVRDISERTRIDAERAQLEANLAEEKLNTERARLEAQLHQSQRLESLGQLAGGVAHDFNNLLAGIMNYAGLVSSTLTEEIERRGFGEEEAFATLVEDVGEITAAAKRAAALTQQLLIFGHREVMKPEVIDLNSVVTDMEKLLARTIGEHVQLLTSMAPDLPRIFADRGQLEQVLMNLAVNARDAMPEGGRLQIGTCAVEFPDADAPDGLLRLPAGGFVQLTVSDTGTGMAKEVAARAFEPFFSTKPKSQGSGLGLATVHGIVTQAGGRLFIYSEPGLGTTMRVMLPVTAEVSTPAPDGAADRKRSTLGHGETVLLVEDEDIVRIPAQRILSRSGYRVLSAEGTEQALDLAAAHPGDIDLLLTDVVMRGRSGKELADELLRLRPEVKVLFMSGYSEDVIVHQGVLEEGVVLVEKPFSADALLLKIRDVLGGVV
ncbi:MAG: PAS domain S-box protein [Sporichthyaceae bacterium]